MDQRQNKYTQNPNNTNNTNTPINLLTIKKSSINQKQQKTNKQLIRLIESNQTIFDNLAKSLSNQINQYQMAFNQKDRDFQIFRQHASKFKNNSFQFIDMISKVKSNCSTIIQSLPEQTRLVQKDGIDDFDMFVDEQIDRTIEFKLNKVKYQKQEGNYFQRVSD